MVHPILLDYLHHLNNKGNTFRLKIVYENAKILSKQVENQTTIKQLLDCIGCNEIYDIQILYKSRGEYYQSDHAKIICYKDLEGNVKLFKKVSNQRYETVKDFVLFGFATKKLIIQKCSGIFYEFHLSFSFPSEKLIESDKIFFVFSEDKFNLQKFLSKCLSAYAIEISKIKEPNEISSCIFIFDIDILVKKRKNIFQRLISNLIE